MQHFYHKLWHTSSEMLSFLHRWDYCWKCEFDIDIKTENYITMMVNNYFFIVHIKTQSKKKDVHVILILMQRQRIPIYLIKLYSRERQMPYSTWRKLTWMNRNWRGKQENAKHFNNRCGWKDWDAVSGKKEYSFVRK